MILGLSFKMCFILNLSNHIETGSLSNIPVNLVLQKLLIGSLLLLLSQSYPEFSAPGNLLLRGSIQQDHSR